MSASVSIRQFRNIIRMYIRHARNEKRNGYDGYFYSIDRIRHMWPVR